MSSSRSERGTTRRATLAWTSLTVALALGAASGCGPSHPPTYPVHGTVGFPTGDPVRSGYIELVPDAGGPSARGAIDSQGHFVVGSYEADDGALAGDYTVLVTQHVQPLNPERARALGPDHAEHADANHRVSLRYASRANSDLRCTVRESDNELQLTVEPHEAPPRGERTEPAE